MTASPRRRSIFLAWVAVSLGVSAVTLWLAVRGVDVGDVMDAVRGADPILLALGMALIMAPYPITAVRWRIIARGVNPPGIRLMTELVFLGAATTNALPGRLGEPVRALGLARISRSPFMRAVGTVVVDRVVDVVFACVCLAATIGTVGDASWVRWTGVLSAAVALLGLALILVAATSRGRLSSRLGLRRWRRHLVPLREGLDCLRGPRILTSTIALTALAWTTWMMGAWLVARALEIELSVAGTVFLFSLLALGSAIPSAPGFVGTYHWVATNALALLGVAAAPSLAFAVVLHGVWFLLTTALGVGAMLHLGLGLPAIRRVREAATGTATSQHLDGAVEASAGATGSDSQIV